MKNRTPVPRSERPPLPDFAPVPRKHARHDGWTPERQRAFIEALADTGSVSRAAAQVNMTTVGAYYLRRQAGADGFRRAWEAALDFGVARMKDIAFERAIEGYLVPCFVGGKLIGWRRKYNDRLLMFCLRHYGQDENGRRTRVEYFSTRASAGASGAPSGRQQAAACRVGLDGQATQSATLASARDAGPDRPACRPEGEDTFDVTNSVRDGAAAMATAETTTIRTITSGRSNDAPDLDQSTAVIESFEGLALDDAARAEIFAVLKDCAARQRALAGTPDDPQEPFISVEQEPREMLVHDPGFDHPRKELRRPPPASDIVVEAGEFLEQSPRQLIQPDDQFRSGPEEFDWQMLDQEEEMARIEEAVESVKRAKGKAKARRDFEHRRASDT